MELSLDKRDKKKVSQIWQQIYDQLRQWEEGSVSSLYGEQTQSIETGQLQKRFAKVRVF
jgi:hypothetical protein